MEKPSVDTQLRLTSQEPRRRGRSTSVRLSETARRTGREGVAMARRELDRARNAFDDADTKRPPVTHRDQSSPQHAAARNAA